MSELDRYDVVGSLGKCHGCSTFFDQTDIEPTEDGNYYLAEDVDDRLAELNLLLDESIAQTDDCLDIIRDLM